MLSWEDLFSWLRSCFLGMGELYMNVGELWTWFIGATSGDSCNLSGRDTWIPINQFCSCLLPRQCDDEMGNISSGFGVEVHWSKGKQTLWKVIVKNDSIPNKSHQHGLYIPMHPELFHWTSCVCKSHEYSSYHARSSDQTCTSHSPRLQSPRSPLDPQKPDPFWVQHHLSLT